MKNSSDKLEIIKVQLIEWFDQHFYKIEIDGKIEYLPSVTTKLGAKANPFLARWRGDIGNREADRRMEKAGDFGTRIHHAWYAITTGGAVVYNPESFETIKDSKLADLITQLNGNVKVISNQEEMLQCHKLSRWLDLVKPEVLSSEFIVYSTRNKEAGMADNLMKISGGEYEVNGRTPLEIPEGRYIVDLKTGNLYPEAYKQVAAYTVFYEEMTNESIDGAIIIHTKAQTKNGIEGLKTVLLNKEDLSEHYIKYRAIAEVWDNEFGDLKPKVIEFPSILKYE